MVSTVEPSPSRILLRASTIGWRVVIDVEKASRVVAVASSMLSDGDRAPCFSFDGEFFLLLWFAGVLLFITAREPDLVMRGAAGFGWAAPSVTPLVGGFGIKAEGFRVNVGCSELHIDGGCSGNMFMLKTLP